MSGKPKVAFFDFACCEGCQLQIADLEEEIIGLVGLVDVVEFREVLTGSAPAYDVAFIEGSITRPEDETRLKDIRARSKLLAAFGACACTGGVNKLKNLRDLTTVRKEVYGDKWDMPHLATYPTKAVHEVVKVDAFVPGCPINRQEFMTIVKSLVMGLAPKLPDYPVCVECKKRDIVCLYERGLTCLGPVARAGCDAICPANGAPCEACRGGVPDPNRNSMKEVLTKYNVPLDAIMRKFTIYAFDPEAGR
jgi:coenzyme F420-reducing hydrogenase gamma subunit